MFVFKDVFSRILNFREHRIQSRVGALHLLNGFPQIKRHKGYTSSKYWKRGLNLNGPRIIN